MCVFLCAVSVCVCVCVCLLCTCSLSFPHSSCLSVDAAVCLCSRPFGPNAQLPRSQAVWRKVQPREGGMEGGGGGGRWGFRGALSEAIKAASGTPR